MAQKKKEAAVSVETTAADKTQNDNTMVPVEKSSPLIVVEQIPIISERLMTVKEEVHKKAEQAMSLVCTEDNYKVIKQIRAALRKEFDALEEQRKIVKAQVAEPYKQFEAVYKDCVADAYKAADADLKAKITEVEDAIKEQKRDLLWRLFIEYCEAKDIPERFRWMGEVKIGLSDSDTSINFMAQQRADEIWNDLRTISYQEYKDEILVEYANGMSASQAISNVMERHRALEEQAKADEEKALEDNPWDGVIGTQSITIRVRSTRAGLKALKEWLEEHDYNWREV